MIYAFLSEMMGKKKSDKQTERIFYTFKEAMVCLAVSKYTLRKLMKSGLPSHRIGKKIVFLKDDLVKWIKDH